MSAKKKRKSGDRSGPPPGRASRRGGAGPGAWATARVSHRARQVVYLTPEVRPEKVAAIKEAIEAGTYKIDSEKLADILIDELLPERAKPPK